MHLYKLGKQKKKMKFMFFELAKTKKKFMCFELF